MRSDRVVAVAAAAFVAAGIFALAHGPGASRWGGWRDGPVGPGMMATMGHGPGMGGPGIGGAGRAAMWGPEPSRAFTADDVRRIVDGRLAWRRNDRLKIGKIEERDANAIVVEIVTVDGSLVDRVAVDRNTGRGRRVP